MRRFSCPSCGKSLWLRMLPFASVTAGQFRFSCSHCGAVLTYAAPQPLIEGPRERLRGARLRAVVIYLMAIVLLSVIAAVLGRAYAFTALGVVALILLACYLFSSTPAYRLAEPESPSGGGKP